MTRRGLTRSGNASTERAVPESVTEPEVPPSAAEASTEKSRLAGVTSTRSMPLTVLRARTSKRYEPSARPVAGVWVPEPLHGPKAGRLPGVVGTGTTRHSKPEMADV